MPSLQSSGAISINDIKTIFGGPTSPSLGNYYRAGTFIPASKSVLVTTTEGPFYSIPYRWYNGIVNYPSYIFWNGVRVAYPAYNATTYTTGSTTYVRGTVMYNYAAYETDTSGIGKGIFRYVAWDAYQVSKSTSVIGSQAINTGIPSSGAISLSQFYGAERP